MFENDSEMLLPLDWLVIPIPKLLGTSFVLFARLCSEVTDRVHASHTMDIERTLRSRFSMRANEQICERGFDGSDTTRARTWRGIRARLAWTARLRPALN